MKKLTKIIESVESGDLVVVPVSQEELAELGWHFEEDEKYDRFRLGFRNDQYCLLGENSIGWNPGYGVTNYGQKEEFDEGNWVASDNGDFGDEEGLKEFFDLIEKNL